MKKSKNFLILALFFLIFTSACSTQGENKENSKNDEEFAFRRPDFGQPEEKPEIVGLVKSIIGNEVTILKIERSEGSGMFERGDGEKQEDGDEKSAPSMGMGTGGGRIPGMGGGRTGTMDSDQEAQRLEMMKKMSTGEDKVIIPVGIQMLKRDESSETRPEMIEASLVDIKQDKMIQIWLDENAGERKIANFVMIMR